MASKAVLLDLDGVVLHQPRVMQYLVRKVGRYVRNTCPRSVRTVMDGAYLNNFLYTNYGHTLLGMRALYGAEAPPIDHFHRHVYDEEMLTYLRIHKHDDTFLQRVEEVADLLQHAKNKGIPCYIFSNAPHVWVDAVIHQANIQDYFHAEAVMSSDHPVFQNGLLKPESKLYDYVANYIRNTQYDKDIELVFVDDSFSNLKPILHDPSWSPVYLVNEGYVPNVKHIKAVRNLRDVIPLV